MGMTNAEAREHLKDILCDVPNDKCIDWIMALKQAIKALEQQPCEDCISRAEALHACCDEWNKDYKAIMKSIRQLPSVTPQQTRWIPVSERLPEDYIHVLCQFTLGGMGECYLAHGVFHVVGGLVMTCNEVIAWMPLPEPYKAESEENADDK